MSDNKKEEKNLRLFYTEEGHFFNDNELKSIESFSFKYPLPSKDFSTDKSIKNTVDVDNLVIRLRSHSYEGSVIGYGKQKIKFKVKLLLDPEMKSCLIFETKEYTYDFGNKYFIKLNDWINDLKSNK